MILAIISLVLLFLLFLAVIILAVSGALAPPIASDFAPVFVFMSLGFFIAVIVINVVFNRKR